VSIYYSVRGCVIVEQEIEEAFEYNRDLDLTEQAMEALKRSAVIPPWRRIVKVDIDELMEV